MPTVTLIVRNQHNEIIAEFEIECKSFLSMQDYLEAYRNVDTLQTKYFDKYKEILSIEVLEDVLTY
jgi:hypothetical protein